MQDKTEFMPLGKAIQKPEPVKADPVREFEKHNHDIPGAKLPRVTPEMASRALRSLLKEEYEREQAKIAAQASGTSVIGHWMNVVAEVCGVTKDREYTEPWEGLFQKRSAKQMERLDKLSELSKPPALTWPTLPDLPEPTFLPEVVNPAPRNDWKVVDTVQKLMWDTEGVVSIHTDDMNALFRYFGGSIPESWKWQLLAFDGVPRLAI